MEMPNLENLAYEDAQAKLSSLGLKVGNVTKKNSDSYSPNVVMSQNITPGSKVEKGTSVDLVVSIGPELKAKTITVDASAYIPDDGAGHTVTVFVTDESGKTQHDTQSGCRYGDNVILTFDVLGNYESRIKIDGNYVN